jgi:hypothetical protein
MLRGVLTVVGPLLLIAAIIYVTIRERTSKRTNSEVTEQGARDVRAEIQRDEEEAR